MMSWLDSNNNALYIAGILLCLLAFAPTHATSQEESTGPRTLDELLGQFREMPGLEAEFQESKHLALLAAPLQSRGRIYFAPPSTLLRRVEVPEASDILITPREVRQRQGVREEVIDLGARPEIQPLVESMLWLFAGNREALESAYEVGFEHHTENASWRVTLRPRSAPLNRLLRHMQISGQSREVRRIEIQETSGDRTLTEILRANPRRRLSRDDVERLFTTSGS